jgi:hypothetical protein
MHAVEEETERRNKVYEIMSPLGTEGCGEHLRNEWSEE